MHGETIKIILHTYLSKLFASNFETDFDLTDKYWYFGACLRIAMNI